MSEQTAASSPGSRGGSSAQSTDEASIDARLDDLATSVRRIELGASGDEPGGPPSEEEPANGLARLVLSLVQLLHDVLEKQAIRRMETGRLTEEEIERVGGAGRWRCHTHRYAGCSLESSENIFGFE